MRKFWRSLSVAAFTVVASAAIVGILAGSFFVGTFLFVRLSEGRLLAQDVRFLVRGGGVLLFSAIVLWAVWWLGRRLLGNEMFGSSFRQVSPKTGKGEQFTMNASAVLMFGIGAVWLYERASGNEWMRLAEVLVWFVVIFLALHLRVFLHELGHLWAAQVLGMQRIKIQVGAGRLLWGRLWEGGPRWEWRLWPQIGLVYAQQTGLRGFKWRQIAFIAGGPVMDGLMICAGYMLIAGTFGGLIAAYTESAAGVVAFALFWLTTTSAINGLIPHRIHFGLHKIHTDGYWLFRLLLLSDADAKQFVARKSWEEFNALAEQVRRYAQEAERKIIQGP